MLSLIQPEIIFNLASITNSEECIKRPIETLEINGLLICKIISIISKLNIKTRVINTCSCEIYKGNGNYIIQEDDINYNPTHPYAFAKLLSHNMVKYYRDMQNMWTSNAILFTTESPYRKDAFLIKKCVNHIKDWKSGKKTILNLGNIDSYRNINHAQDIADALFLISQQENGGDYLACSDIYLSVKNIIINMYKCAGIYLIENFEENKFSFEGEILIKFNTNTHNRIFIDTNLNGLPSKLKNIGWKAKFNKDILIFKDLIES